MSSTRTKPAIGTRVDVRDVGTNLLVIDPALHKRVGESSVTCAEATNADPALFLVERPVAGWEAERLTDSTIVRAWYCRVPEITSPETDTTPAAPDTVTLNGTTFAIGSLLGEAATHVLTLPQGTVSRDVLERVIAACNVQEREKRRAEERAENFRQNYQRVDREFDAFKEQVRDLIIEKAVSGSICHDGASRALEALGLPPMARTWRVSVEIKQTVVVEVTATDEDDAMERAENEYDVDALLAEADRYSWDIRTEDAESV